MKCIEAFEAMKQGVKVKLPSWGGYWRWDQKKETIMMHCRPQDADQGQGRFWIYGRHREWNIH